MDQPADWASGPDARRHGANEIGLDVTVVDYVDVPGGDRTDWKYFTVPASGVIDLLVTFDNPKALGQVLVVDDVGRIIASFEDEKRRLLDKITFKADAGRYYVQVWVLDEDSSYSVQAAYQPLQIGSF